jgi:hypothetical protein
VPALPNRLNTTSAAGSQWAWSYQLQNDDTTLMNITGKSFEFVIRPTVADVTEPALIAVNSTASNAQGYITVTPSTSTVLVVLSPTATALIGANSYPYALWMDPGLPDATNLVGGTFFSSLVAAA